MLISCKNCFRTRSAQPYGSARTIQVEHCMRCSPIPMSQKEEDETLASILTDDKNHQEENNERRPNRTEGNR